MLKWENWRWWLAGDDSVGNRTHWLLFDRNSWKKLDDAGYTYDTTFGYNDDAGFRAGTLQVCHPEGCSKLLELPLHIQDIGLFGNFCWAPVDKGWKKHPVFTLMNMQLMSTVIISFIMPGTMAGRSRYSGITRT
ncbi:MAG: hypothetical protein WC620_08995 [Methanoregula sp.]|jgi:hypothetical protein